MPTSVTTIGDSAFSHCDNLTEMILPANLTSIGESAFYFCFSLVGQIDIPEGVTRIEESTFNYCSSLEEITIPSTVTSMGHAPFWGCHNLKEIKVAENNAYYASENGILFDKEKITLISCPGKKEIVIPESVTSIGCHAFNSCSNLNNSNFALE